MTDEEYMGEVARCPCMICGGHPVIVHHCICGRFSRRRAPDTDTIPLCPLHHVKNAEGEFSIHGDRELFEMLYGPDTDYIDQTRRFVLGPDWEQWEAYDGGIKRAA